MFKSGGDFMSIKLWKVHFQNPHLSGDFESVVVQAPNARCAIDRACKLTLVSTRSKRNAVESVDLIGVAQN